MNAAVRPCRVMVTGSLHGVEQLAEAVLRFHGGDGDHG